MIRRAIVAGFAALCVLGVTAPAAAADVTWDRNTLREIYNAPDGFYTYAPSVVADGATTWIWTCHNNEFRVIKDHIYETKIVNGTVASSRSVLRASPAPAWDSFHVCDPSVVAGRFSYGGTTYRYAMFYLGNDLDASAHNQVGVAFATSPAGPWRKYPRPIVTFDRLDQWGVGQPSAVSLKPDSGRVILFYTKGDTSTRAYQQVFDLTSVDKLTTANPVLVTTSGLVGRDGGADWLNGYDMAYDRGRFYAIREQHPYPQDNPWWIGASVQVASIDAKSVFGGGGTWRVEADINEQLTGFARNHNAGLTRNWHGSLAVPGRVDAVFTDSCAGSACDSLFSYDLWSISGTIG